MKGFGANLRAKASQMGLSNVELARRSDIPERSISHYMNDRNEPDLGALVRLSQALGCSPNDLLLVKDVASSSAKGLLLQRLNAAAQSLSPNHIEGLALQAEALAKRPKRPPAKKRSEQ
jgi:transcriptional regulator with XRE-family HTH domain